MSKGVLLVFPSIVLFGSLASGKSVRQWSRRPGFNPRLSHTTDFKKWYLIPPCLTLSNIQYISSVKWSNPGKGVAPSPTPWYSSYQKRSLLVTLNHSHQLYLTFTLYFGYTNAKIDPWLVVT